MSRGLVWFRRDLRLDDNPAWSAATTNNTEVVALFVIDPKLWDRCHQRRIDQLSDHLGMLDHRLRAQGSELRVERGDPIEVVTAIAAGAKIDDIYFNLDLSPFARHRDEQLLLPHQTFWGGYVHPVGSILTGEDRPFQVFTPFYRAWSARPLPSLPPLEPDDSLDRLTDFLGRVDRYREERDRPDLDTTSGLSVDLKWGTISPRRIFDAVGGGTMSREAFVRQLAWREFYAQLMWAHPRTVEEPLRTEYMAIQWQNDLEEFTAWKEGRTGYPIVDAGMRQLRTTGLMHNRIRLLTASFLVKHLLIDWRWGEKWFRRMLADSDTAQNVGNWQWVAGTGADAAPYFRIFNPVSQARRFDPDGEYVRRWVPELRALAGASIHAPWEATPLDLAAAGVGLGVDYPYPIVDHGFARARCLDAYQAARGTETSG